MAIVSILRDASAGFDRRRKLASALFCAVLLAGCAGGSDFLELAEPTGHHPFPVRNATLGRDHHEIHGIDIAKYQGNIDWHKVKQSGVAFAFIKATEGADRLDNKFHENWAAAKAAGLPRGAYHFNYWCSPMENQFEWFKRNVPVEKDSLPPVLDLEWNHQSPTCPRKVPKAVAQREIRTFVRLAEAHYGKRPILYTDIRFYRDVLSDGSFDRYPLWVRATKKLPQEIYPGRRWAFWQYSDRARVPGIRGRVDKNTFAGSRRAWQRLVASNFAMKNRITPVAKPVEKKSPDKQKPVVAPATMIAKIGATAGSQTGTDKINPHATAAAKQTPGKKIAGIAKAKTQSRAANRSAAQKTRAFVATNKPLSLTPINLAPKR